MALDVGAIQATLTLDTKQFEAGVAKAKSSSGGLSSAIDGIGKGSEIMAAGMAVAATAAVAFGVKAVQSFSESQQVTAQLDAVLKSTGATQQKVSKIFVQGAGDVVISQQASAKEIKANEKEIAKQTKTVDSAQSHIATYKDQLALTTARISDMTKSLADGKPHSAVFIEQLSLAKERVGTLQDKINRLSSVVQNNGSITSVAADATKTLKGHYETIVRPAMLSRDAIIELSKSIEYTSGISREAVLSTENMLLTFTNIGGDNFKDTTSAVTDMATAMNGGAIPSMEALRATAIQVGKAMNDPTKGITALHRVGVAFTDQQKEQIKTMQAAGDMAGAQAIILKELNTEFGGSATAAGSTFAGALARLNNVWNEFMVAVGGEIVSVITPMINKLLEWADSMGGPQAMLDNLNKTISEHKDLLQQVAIGIAAVAIVVGVGLVAAFVAANAAAFPFIAIALGIGAVVTLLAHAFGITGDQFESFVVGAGKRLMDFFKELYSIVMPKVQAGWKMIQDAIQANMPIINAIWNVMKKLGEWALSQFIPLFKVMQKLWNDNQNVIQLLGKALLVIAAIFGGAILLAIMAVVGAVGLLIQFFTNVLKVLDQFSKAVAPVFGAISSALSSSVGMVGGEANKIASGKGFAYGGIVRTPTRAMVGESGPEAVVPLNSQHTNNVTFNNVVRNDNDIASISNQVSRILGRQSELHGLGINA